MFYVYVLMSRANQRLYVGRTSDLRARLGEHLKGKTWTMARMSDLVLVFYEAFKAKSDAIRRERYLKTSKGKSSLRQVIRDSLVV